MHHLHSSHILERLAAVIIYETPIKLGDKRCLNVRVALREELLVIRIAPLFERLRLDREGVLGLGPSIEVLILQLYVAKLLGFGDCLLHILDVRVLRGEVVGDLFRRLWVLCLLELTAAFDLTFGASFVFHYDISSLVWRLDYNSVLVSLKEVFRHRSVLK